MYRFPLESLHEYRKRQEEISQKDLSECKRELNNEIKKLQDLSTLKNKASKKIRQIQENRFKASENLLYDNYIENISKKIFEQNTNINKIEIKKRKKTDELLKTVKKRKMIDKLKEYGFKEYQKGMAKITQNQLDESSVLGFARKLYIKP